MLTESDACNAEEQTHKKTNNSFLTMVYFFDDRGRRNQIFYY